MDVPEEVLECMSGVKNIAVLTGAGISAESGIVTFRGKDGLWDRFDPDEVATPGAWQRDPLKVWNFHHDLLLAISDTEPNAAHIALAEMEDHFEEFHVITQNIDQFHQDAGSKNVIELHGNAWRLKCIREGTTTTDFTLPLKELPPRCSCGSFLRPDVVWFNEPLPAAALEAAFELAKRCQVMFVIGTSAYVQPAASLPFVAHDNGAAIFEFNLEPTPHTHLALYSFFGKAGETLPRFWEAIKQL